MIALAIALGAGAGAGDDDAKGPLSKDQKWQRMTAIGDAVATIRSAPVTPRGRAQIDELLREYQTLSDSLGGDDPAHLIAHHDRAPIKNARQNTNEGGIASAPPPPPGCTATPSTFSNTTPQPIPVVPPSAVTSSNITVSGAGSFLWDVNVTTFITHPVPADLDITIRSPAGTFVTLTTDNGIGPNNFNGTVWDDSANPGGQVPYASNNGMATDHAYVSGLLASPLTPEEALGAFFGEDPNGIWTLTISDDTQNGSSGTLTSWSLQITTAASAPTISAAPTQTNSTPLAISAAGTPVITSNITVAGLGPVIADLDLTTFITHTSNADLDITLRSPAGTIVTITTDNGGSNDNVFNGTLWNDKANSGGQVPYTSNNGLVTDNAYVNLVVANPLVPEEALAAFIGQDPNGVWTLTISDDANLDGGSLNSWSLDFDTTAGVPTLTTNTFSNSTPAQIDPPVLVTSTVTVSGAGTYLWDLDVITNITHSSCGDLDITLRSPAGTIVTITTDNGAALDNVYNGTTFDDDANPAGQVPYGANNGMVTDQTYTNLTTATPLTPEEALGAFLGEDPNGVWTLTINDDTPATDGGSLASWTMNLSTLAAAPTSASSLNFANTSAQPIPAGSMPTITSTVTVSGAATFLCNVNLHLGITHSFNSDLDITLLSPAGTIVTITTDNGGSNDNVFAGTLFNDKANPAGQVPYVTNAGLVTDHPYADLVVATPLAPEEPLAAFIGEDPNGTWTLTVSDDTVGDGGSLNSWSIDVITCTCGGAPPPCRGNIVINNPGPQRVDVDDLIAVITHWGACPAPCPPTCPQDIAPFGPPMGNCFVNVDDLLEVITHWGLCP